MPTLRRRNPSRPRAARRLSPRRLFAAGLFALLAAAGSQAADVPLTTVPDFDARRYLGRWHQVAAIPAWFQEDCAANTVTEYSRLEDGRIKVVNTCDTADGEVKRAEARGRYPEPSDGTRLEATFINLLGFWFWPASGDYWVIGLDPNYEWSVVGQPSRKYAWVLAREPELDPATLGRIRTILEGAGYDPCALNLTTPGGQGRLCDAAW